MLAKVRKPHQYLLYYLGFKSYNNAVRFKRYQPWTIRREITVLNAICVWIRLHARARSAIVKGSWQNGSQTPVQIFCPERTITTELFHLTDSVKECRTVRRRDFLSRARLASHALLVLKVTIYYTFTFVLYIYICISVRYLIVREIKAIKDDRQNASGTKL